VADHQATYDDLIGQCRFPLVVRDLPNSSFYTPSLGNRNPVTVSASQATEGAARDIVVPYVPAAS